MITMSNQNLTEQEVKILKALSEGYKVKEISVIVKLSEFMVQYRIKRLTKKFKARSTTALVVEWLKTELANSAKAE